MRSARAEVIAVQVIGVLGVLALLEGARRIYVPAAFLLAGALFVVFAVLKSAQLSSEQPSRGRR